MFKLARLAPILIILAVAAPARAAAPGSPCTGSASRASALSQYCEDIPTASGNGSQGSGTVGRASGLAPGIVRKIDAVSPANAKRLLLTLPAEHHHGTRVRTSGSVSPRADAVSTGSGFALPLVLVLVAIGLLFALVAWRRRQGSDSGAAA